MRVFVSYAHEDRVRAADIAAACGELGHTVFIDDRLQSGDGFRDELEREVRAADVVIVVWSKASVRSAWVREEAELARACGSYRPVGVGVDPPFGFREVHTPKVGLLSSAEETVGVLGLGVLAPTPRVVPHVSEQPDLGWYDQPGVFGRMFGWVTRPR